ncbi:vanadium-dependent haloperoxidase [Mucilaginibacter agri]|uniref:Phosphatase PAP2 family protein n=1 Tax=Mucilaginibacter agri TaxID=2695265 RepID=A0A965ZJR7_9SPHI|nr:vanadium-dependent haloperoxidase [Mucilaginibacter agri]NCD72453.1 phosphatase PAP2 family protein [Mucilaginibacter agri]
MKKTGKFLIILGLISHQARAYKAPQPAYLEIAPVVSAINMVMIHDVISPPVAARYYAYAMMSAYQIVSQNNAQIPGLASFVREYPVTSVIAKANKDFDYRVAAKYAIYETAKNMLPSGYMLQEDEDTFIAELKRQNYTQAAIDKIVKVAVESSAQVINFSKIDNYGKLSAKLRYTPLKGEGSWYPTPPAYMDAVEPHWNSIKPLMADSAAQFKPAPPVAFSKDSTSQFYKLAMAVYNVSKNPSREQLFIASFWDCNPFAVTTSGHMSIGFKKISPGGHWMNIAAMAVKKANLTFDQSVLVVTMEAATLMDTFICCWDEKYLTNRLRPETYINKYVDITWRPFLQTPPFPEYTSGHAIVSNSSATILTYLLGDKFAYTDDTEIPFGVDARSFTSFKQAAAEASISRFYGGIHYTDSIEEGNKQGVDLGNYVIARIKKAGIKPLR